MTLIEVMVASALMLLLAAGTYSLFFNGVRFARDSEARLSLQKNLLGAVGLLGMELAESNPTSVRYDPIPAGVVFASPRNAEGSLAMAGGGKLSWEKVIAYYIREDGSLVRKEWMLDPYVRQSGFPPALDAGFSTADLAAQPLPERVMARGVEQFMVDVSEGQASIRVTAAQTDSRGRINRVRLQSAVAITN
ncbi:MAG: hypothetical protein KC910_12945 [Candidatus Eremiobacteraeota bacterium]|nr:hypothetical protein [Candidatus Eremiobacteraeota bacterium]